MLGELVGLPEHGRLDVRLEVLVAGDGYPFLELAERADSPEAVAAAVCTVRVGPQDLAQQPML
jgi:hypothetical protein